MASQYLLGRNYISSARLNLQHYLWREALGYNLHPEIANAVNDQASLRIADVGTGTGIWLCDLAPHLPETAILDGFDICADQFPHKASLPSNIKLKVLDAKASPPENFCGIYDVVHVRMFLAVIDDDDPKPVLNHCRKLLKPGGYLQWDEFDPTVLQAVPKAPDSAMPCLRALADIFNTTKPVSWIAKSADHFHDSGFDVIATEARTEQPWQRHTMMEIWCLVADEFASVLERSEQSRQADEVRQLSQGAYTEIKNGSYFSQTWRITVGRKK